MTDIQNKKTILIVDDHPVFCQGLADIINQEMDFIVCGYAEESHQAMEQVKKLQPDMVIVDITLKSTSGLDLIKDLNIQYPNMPLLALSMHDESLYAERVLRAGAMGYIMKLEATENVVKAIREVLSGNLYLSERMKSRVLRGLVGTTRTDKKTPIQTLSDREFEVLCMIGRGDGVGQIAENLHLSVKTIETYRTHIKEKLKLDNAAELRKYAIEWLRNNQ